MSSTKRKRYSKDLQCVYFPDDVQHAVQRAGREPSTLSSASSAKSWEKVGDSFLDMRATKNPKSSGRKLSAVKKLIQTPASVQTSGTHHTEDPVHIAWSSSDSGASGDETQEQNQSRAVALQRQRPRRPRRYMASIQSYRRDLSKLSCDQDDLPTIDTDSDLIESEEDVEKDSGQQISECESQLFDEEPKDLLLKPTNVAELEISGYVSDGENIGDTMILSKLESEIFPLQTGEGSTRSVSDWVRSAQAMLQTPQKPLDRVAKTPEDSAKKRRKLQSGGFAERLNRLQCRQRSSINFWRHQSMSDTSATTVDRPGVLVLRVLEVQEECSMQLVRCEHHEPPTQDPQCNNPVAKESARLLLLFTKETAAQLIPAPGDIIHIHPPWQRLSVEGFSCDIILNTHFSQKVSSASNPANISLSRSLLSVKRRMPYYLGKIFGLLEPWKTNTENNGKQVAVPDGLCHTRGVGVLNRHCLSLLEAIEALGQAGRVGQDVEVVVQRVFSIPVPDNSAVSIRKSRGPSGPTSAPLLSEKGKTRLCVLVQDSYGIFSVVQLHQLPCKDDLLCYCQRWQGKTCVLRAIKVVQRVTRERRTRLFSLIDSLWPPMMLLKDHGMTQSMSSESRPAGPAPSFCYLLSGQETSVEPTEGQTFSAMYFPPTGQTLRDILKIEMKTCRCTFVATVLYKRMQSSDVGHGEVWLVLTDPSLQEEHSEKPCRRTVALCVSTSCVLTSAVLEALHSSTAWCMLFRDAIKENGVLLCAEQSVVEMCPVESEDSFQSKTRSEQHSKSLTELQAKTLSQPVRLDPLSVQTTPNSLCTLTGTIVGVDENTAYSWPACNYCGSDNLQLFTEKPQSFHCTSCKSVVDKPERKIQLEVFLRSPNLNSCTLKVKLQKKTILSILNTTPLEGNEFPGYDVENVLGKEVGPLTVYVRVVTRKPAPWIGLEEICL